VDAEAIIADRRAGMPIKTLCKKYRRNQRYIYQVLEEAGVIIDGRVKAGFDKRGRVLQAALRPGLDVELSVAEWASAAGLLDGEGTISRDNPRGYSAAYRVTIAQKDRRLLEWFMEIFQAGVIQESKGTCATWRIQRARLVYDFLVGCLPYLIVKRESALQTIKTLEERYGWSCSYVNESISCESER
jgi:hypothetical protein